MTRFVASAFSKVNLSLCIVGKRDNLHLLDMIVLPYEKYCDTAIFEKDDTVCGIQIKDVQTSLDYLDEDRFVASLCEKLSLISNYYSINGYISINKEVPLGGGLGGSTATIVAIVKAIESASNKKSDTAFLLALGSDVPCMYFGAPCRVQGVGEIVTPIEVDCDVEIVDYYVEGGVDSGEAYKVFDEWFNKLPQFKKEAFLSQIVPTSVSQAVEFLRNDLQNSACFLNPKISKKLAETDGRVMMTGSGSCVIEVKVAK